MLLGPSEANDGIPVFGTPSDTIFASFAVESRSGRAPAMFWARSLPLPSNPWQAAQCDAKICFPLACAPAALSFPPELASCENAYTQQISQTVRVLVARYPVPIFFTL